MSIEIIAEFPAVRPAPPWELTNKRPCSISGVELEGRNLSRHVYVDESGISVNESVFIVAGVLINGDSQWDPVETYIEQLIEKYVPEPSRKGFLGFHAKELFHGSGPIFDRRKYALARSHEALKEVLKIPALFGLPICFSFIRKNLSPEAKSIPHLPKRKRRLNTGIMHTLGLSFCAIGAETCMRQFATANEVATLIAENNTETREIVRRTYPILKGRGFTTKFEERYFSTFSEHLPPGFLPIKRIKDTVHFVEKRDAPLLQIADACAMVIRFAYEGRKDAEGFINVLTSNQPERLLATETQNLVAGMGTFCILPQP